MSIRPPVLLVAALFLVPSLSLAQGTSSSETGLSRLVADLLLRGITLPGAAAPGNPHSGHFTLGNPTFGGSQAASRADTSEP